LGIAELSWLAMFSILHHGPACRQLASAAAQKKTPGIAPRGFHWRAADQWPEAPAAPMPVSERTICAS
jgi:hypothetical protein